MAKTRQITVNTTPTAITPATACKYITLIEDAGVAGWPTTDYVIRAPSSTDAPYRVLAGQPYVLGSGNSFFVAGTTYAFIATVSGSTTFDIHEDTT